MTTKPLKKRLDTRHEARKLALQVLFEASFHKCNLHQAATRIQEDLLLSGLDSDLLTDILDGVENHRDEIDLLISRCAPEWPLEQLPKLDLNILRIAIYELYIARNVPSKVAIDEAVELAKEFGADSTSSFVNGALGTIVKFRENALSADSALFVGRFQPLHRGHLAALRQIGSRFPKVVVGLVGASEEISSNAPLRQKEQLAMLKDVLSTLSLQEDSREAPTTGEVDFQIISLPAANDPALVDQAKAKAKDLGAVFTNNDRISKQFASAGYPVFRTQSHRPEELSGKVVRQRIRHGLDWNKLVPMKVERYLKQHKLIERIREMAVAK